MKKELLLGLGVLGVVSLFALSREQKDSIGKEQHWQCQWPGCERKFRDGWMLEFNHEIPGVDDPKQVKLYCQEHHALWHKRRGETIAVNQIHERIKTSGGRTLGWSERNRRRR